MCDKMLHVFDAASVFGNICVSQYMFMKMWPLIISKKKGINYQSLEWKNSSGYLQCIFVRFQ